MIRQLRPHAARKAAPRRQGRHVALLLAAAALAAVAVVPFHYSHFSSAGALLHEADERLHGLTSAIHTEELLARFGVAADDNIIVHRSSFAASMEHALEANATLGICEDGRPLLAGAPNHICTPQVCLWSARLQRNIDLSFHGLADLPWDAHPKRCDEPAGGQSGGGTAAAPAVSLVLLSGGDAALAAQGLLELFRTAKEAETAELLVVDSTAGAGDRLLERAAARLVHCFGVRLRLLHAPADAVPWAAAEVGLRAATAPYAAVVAAGTFVSRGWLYALLHTMHARPQAAVAGPLVLQQEQAVADAGGLVRGNGSVVIKGAGDALSADYAYMRQVDFISHSCFLLRMSAWQAGHSAREAEGLSGMLADAGVMLSVAAQGHTMLLQPAAVAFRQPPPQPPPPPSEQELALFRKRWQHLLQPRGCSVRPPLRGMWDRRSTTRVMWVDDVVPMPDNDSGSVRTLSLLKILIQAGYHLTYQPLLLWRRAYALPLQMMGIRVLPVARPVLWRVTNATGACLYDGFIMARRTNYAIARMWLEENKLCEGAPRVFDTVDLHFMREARELTGKLNITAFDTADGRHVELRSAFDYVEWMDLKAPALVETNENVSDLLGWRSQECELIRTSDATFLVSPDEIKVMEHYVPDSAPRLHLVTNIHDDVTPRRPDCAGREGLLFVGNYNHAPNREAVAFLLTEVLPALRKRLPPALAPLAHAHVVGAGRPNEEMQALLAANAAHATFYGFLPDDELRLLYSRVKVVVAPLLTGAGVKGKVNQAMKLGVPVVGTQTALEGMHAQDGVNCLVADTAGAMAEAVARLLEDCVLWERLALGGFENMRQFFSIESARPAVLETLRKVRLGLPAEGEACAAKQRRR